MTRSRDETIADLIHLFCVLVVTLALAADCFKHVPGSAWWRVTVVPPTKELMQSYAILYGLTYPAGAIARKSLKNETPN